MLSKRIIKVICRFLLISLIFISCSSQPKPQTSVTEVYNYTNQVFMSANSSLASGKLQEARNSLQSAYKGAISIDSKELLCKITLSSIIYSLNSGISSKTSGDEGSLQYSVFPDLPARELYTMANDYALLSQQKTFLTSVCLVYKALILLSENAGANDLRYLLSDIENKQGNFSRDTYFTGFSMRLCGDLNMALKNYSEAEEYYRKAADFHEKNYVLQEIGNDWYCLSRCFSQIGRKSDAIMAIDRALYYDKNAENTFAIASDYYGKAIILAKEKASENELLEAKKLANWAAKIFYSGGFIEQYKSAIDYAGSL